MKNKSFLILLMIIGLLTGVFFFSKKDLEKNNVPKVGQSSESQGSTSFRMTPIETSTLVKEHSPRKGSQSAKVTLVEFLDPECEACAAMSKYVEMLESEYKHDLQVVVRYMPFHGNSKYVANILEGTRQENKYWEALRLLFDSQKQWADHHNPRPELIPDILKPLSLNMNKIVADAKAGRFDKQILEDLEDGKKVGVQGTPTFFVNGHVILDLGYEPLKLAIEEALKK